MYDMIESYDMYLSSALLYTVNDMRYDIILMGTESQTNIYIRQAYGMWLQMIVHQLH